MRDARRKSNVERFEDVPVEEGLFDVKTMQVGFGGGSTAVDNASDRAINDSSENLKARIWSSQLPRVEIFHWQQAGLSSGLQPLFQEEGAKQQRRHCPNRCGR